MSCSGCANMHGMDWDDMKYVLAIERAKTLSAAGEALGVSHTTAGRRLRAVEESLGVRLFDRTPGGLVVTAAGAEVVEVAQETERSVHALEGRLLGQDTRLTGALRVTTMDVFFLRYHEAFTSFTRRYPDVDLTVTSSNEEASLTRREADVALRMTDAPPEYLVGRRVGRVQFALYGQAELVARCGGPDAPWNAFPWISWDERMNLRFLDDYIEARAPGFEVVLRVDFDSSLLHEAIARGVGVHFLSCVVGDADPRLTRIGEPIDEFNRDLWLLTMPDLRANSRVRAFMDHMAAAITADP